MKRLQTIQPYIIIWIVLFNAEVHAQKQAVHWFDWSHHIDFNYDPPKVVQHDILYTGGAFFSAISDHSGKLLFVSDGENVYDKNLNVMPNGYTGVDYDGSFPIVAPTLIVPQPYSSRYYVFVPLYHYSSPTVCTGFSVNYCIVDMKLNDGLGDVIESGKSLHLSENDRFIATGNCEKFWLLTYPSHSGNEGENRDYILKYRIDKEGLNQIPDSITFHGIEGIWQLKFSPTSENLAFIANNSSGPSGPQLFLYEFDGTGGNVFNQQMLNISESWWDNFEFSPNGRFLYITKHGNDGNYNLYQYDISLGTAKEIEESGVLIHKGSFELWIDEKALAPNGMIYCQQASGIGTSKSAVIEHPNRKGQACSLILDANYFLIHEQNHVSSFLATQFDENFKIEAGENTELCINETKVLGQNPTYDIDYQWNSAQFLNNSNISNPTFLYNDTISVKTDFHYILEGKKGYCYNSDTITITVHPDLDASVFGSKSVCPRVEEVDYWTKDDDRFLFEWSIDGGELASGHTTDSIKVNWGPTNADASVTLTPYNELNCPSPPIRFPVRINVELQTETPIGDGLLCSNLATGIPYQITNTNGSVYTWESDYGNIVSGQGTNIINVDWPGDGKYHLLVKEQSTTIDTVCYGVSDSLLVNLFTDSTKIEIDYAGVLYENPEAYEVQWYISDTARVMDDIQIYSSSKMAPVWTFMNVASKTDTYFSFPDTTINYTPMSFRISSVNGCQELIESEVHSTIFLEGLADSSSNKMSLSWTSYLGWSDHIEHYEIWYRKDIESQMTMVASFKPDQYTWSNSWGADAFDHRYRVRALHSTFPFESWSNELTLSFNHSLEIPNVFTPNGDGINDSFDFPNLELYHENELQVYDRNGAEVFSKSDYDGGWTGGNLSAGVYYYSFTEKRNQKTYKGWVQILK